MTQATRDRHDDYLSDARGVLGATPLFTALPVPIFAGLGHLRPLTLLGCVFVFC